MTTLGLALAALWAINAWLNRRRERRYRRIDATIRRANRAIAEIERGLERARAQAGEPEPTAEDLSDAALERLL